MKNLNNRPALSPAANVNWLKSLWNIFQIRADSRRLLLILGIAGLSLAANAQFTTTWTGAAGDNEWTNGLNWDDGNEPDNATGTNEAIIPSGFTINYDQPMVAAAFGGLTNSSILNISTNGFNCAAITMVIPGQPGKIFDLAGGAISVSGNLAFCSNSAVSLSANSSLAVGGSLLVGCGTNGGTSGAGSIGFMTNNGANLSAATTTINPPNASQTSLLIINGGTNSLGNVSVKRCSAGSGGFNTLGTEGLVISNGIVNMNSLNVGGSGGNSFLTTLIVGGFVTNSGNVSVNQGTSGRASRLLQTGGFFVVSDPAIVNPNTTVLTNSIAIYSIIGGTNIVGGFFLGNSNPTVGPGSKGNPVVNVTNAATIYVGSQGINSNGASVVTVALNNGGLFGATADWTGSANMTLSSGTFTFQAADMTGTPHNIALNNPLAGGGTLNKTGGGTLTLNANNTYSGNTLVNTGTLAIGATGSVSNTPAIVVAGGATLDVSAVAGGFVLNNAKTLQGFGTVLGPVNLASGATINPGSNAITGTLNVGGLVENGGAINNFFLASSPGPNNDFLTVTGDLDVTNVNTVQINGSVPGGVAYPLIQYGGNFNGSTANFSIVGATGSLSNNATTKTIYLVTLTAVRGPTNIVWLGNPANNIWDTTTTSNWLNNGHSDYFVPGDNARFDSTGAANPLVNIPGGVTPGSVTVDSTSNYTFLGVGNITGTTGLTKTNSGTLTILTTNDYTGPTLLNGGVLEATNLSASGVPSSIGAASSTPTNLVVTDSVLRYLGPTGASSDHGVTLGDLGGTIDVAGSGTTLTWNGAFSGSALTKAGAGTLVLNTANSHTNIVVQDGTLTLGTPQAAGTGASVISNLDGTTLGIVGAVTVSNAFDAEGTVIVDLNNAGGNTAMDGAWSGSGTVIITNQQNASGRTFTIGGNGFGGGGMANFSGTIECGTSSQDIRFNDGGGNPNTGSPNMTLDLGTSTATFLVRNGGTTINIGALTGGAGTSLSGRGSGTAGTVTYSIGGKGLSTEFDGTIKDGGNATAIALIGGSLRLTGTSTNTGATTVSAGTLQVDGQITLSPITVPGGTLVGIGALGGAVDIQSGGTLIPGEGLGQLTISNSLTLESGSTNIFELNAALGTNSTIVGLSSVSYGGNLIVTNVSGTLSAGQTFTLFTAGSYSGAFDTATLPALPAGLTWDTNGLTVNGSIMVVTVTTPKLAADFSALSSGTITFNATSGEPYAPVSVLSSTNVALPVASWTSVATGAFDASGNFSQSITVDPTTPTQFFILLEQ